MMIINVLSGFGFKLDVCKIRSDAYEHTELTKTDVKMYLLSALPAEHLCSAAAPVTEQLSNCERWWLALAERGGVC